MTSLTTSVRADDDAARRARAGELFRTGTALAKENRWREALSAFEQASLLVPHASTTYNMAYCERGLGRYTRALTLFRRALAEHGPGGLTEEQRTAAESYAAEVAKKVARLDVHVVPADAKVAADGRPLQIEGRSPPVAVAGLLSPGPGRAVPADRFELVIDPGTHVFLVSHDDGRQRTVTRTYGEAERATLTLELPSPRPSPTPLPAPEPAPAVPPVPAFWSAQRIGALVVTGLSAGLLGAGIGLGVHTANTWSEAEDACPNGVRCPDDDGFELSLDARRTGNLATVTFVTAGVAAAASTYLWLTASDEPVQVGMAPARLFVGGRF